MRIVPLGARTRAGKAPSQKPIAAWGGLELLGVDLVPPRIKPGAILELHYHWARRKPSPQDSSDMVVGVFIDAHGSYWMKDGVFWLHDIHEPPSGMRVGDLYEERRILFIPSDFPPGDYALALGLQRKLPPKAAGQEGFSKEFYERAAAQDLDKFIGRGQDGATVQFSQSASGSWKEGLWPVTRSLYPIADPRFVPVAALRVEPRP
jgi:hypothetical protein